MEHLLGGEAPLTAQQAKELAEKLQLATYSLDTEGLRRLNRLAAVLKENPKIVNPSLAPSDAALYYQALYDHVDIFGLTLADL